MNNTNITWMYNNVHPYEVTVFKLLWFCVQNIQIRNHTSSPSKSSISLFSLSPGPMCLSAKSSCLGKILSICREERTAEVRRPRASMFLILHWSFHTMRLWSLRCRQGARGFTDLAKKIPQDFAQLCISESEAKIVRQNREEEREPPSLGSFSLPRLKRSLQETPATPSDCTLYTTAQLHKSAPIGAERLGDVGDEPQTAAKLSHVPTGS